MKLSILICLLIMLTMSCAFADDDENSKITNDEQAKVMLKAGFDKEDKESDKAIEYLKAVLDYNPKFEARYPEEKISSISAVGLLANVYRYKKGEYEEAIKYAELSELYVNERYPHPSELTVWPAFIDDCCAELEKQGKLGDKLLISASSSTSLVFFITDMPTDKTTELYGANWIGAKNSPDVPKPGKYKEEIYYFPAQVISDTYKYSVRLARDGMNPKGNTDIKYFDSNKPIIIRTIKNEKGEIQISKITLPKPITAK